MEEEAGAGEWRDVTLAMEEDGWRLGVERYHPGHGGGGWSWGVEICHPGHGGGWLEIGSGEMSPLSWKRMAGEGEWRREGKIWGRHVFERLVLLSSQGVQALYC